MRSALPERYKKFASQGTDPGGFAPVEKGGLPLFEIRIRRRCGGQARPVARRSNQPWKGRVPVDVRSV